VNAVEIYMTLRNGTFFYYSVSLFNDCKKCNKKILNLHGCVFGNSFNYIGWVRKCVCWTQTVSALEPSGFWWCNIRVNVLTVVRSLIFLIYFLLMLALPPTLQVKDLELSKNFTQITATSPTLLQLRCFLYFDVFFFIGQYCTG